MLVTELNDDCLRHIFGFLHYPARLKAALACRRFADIFAMFVTDSVDLDEAIMDLPRIDANMFFTLYGHRFRCARFVEAMHYSAYHECFFKHCPNLEDLKCRLGNRYNAPRTTATEPLSFFGRTLKKLLSFQTIENTADIAWEEISTLKELRMLHIMDGNLTGVHLARLSKLTELTLESCPDITPKNLFSIIQANKNLRKLNIIYSLKKNTNETFRCPVRTMQQLEWLGLDSNHFDSFDLSQMPNLRHIKIENTNKLKTAKFLEELIRYHSDHLETLELHGYGVALADFWSEELFPNLKRLTFGYNTSITDDFLQILPDSCKFLRRFETTASMNVSADSLKFFVRNLKHLEHLALPYLYPELKRATCFELAEIRKEIGCVAPVLTIQCTKCYDSIPVKNDNDDLKKYIRLIYLYEPPGDFFD